MLFLVWTAPEGSNFRLLELDLLLDLIDESSTRLFAHAKPLDPETWRGPEKGTSPWDAFLMWEASPLKSTDGLGRSRPIIMSPSFRVPRLLPLLLGTPWFWTGNFCREKNHLAFSVYNMQNEGKNAPKFFTGKRKKRIPLQVPVYLSHSVFWLTFWLSQVHGLFH